MVINGLYFAIDKTVSSRSNFPYKEQFHIFLIKMRQSGILKYIDDQFKRRKPNLKYIDESMVPIRFGHVQIIFLSYLIALIIVGIILIIEIFLKKGEIRKIFKTSKK